MSHFPTGKFHVNTSAPEPYGICDRCGFMHALVELQPQKEWRGRELIANNLRICKTCRDVPNEQNRTIMLPVDPVPVVNPRPIPPYAPDQAETWDDGGTFDDDVSEFPA